MSLKPLPEAIKILESNPSPEYVNYFIKNYGEENLPTKFKPKPSTMPKTFYESLTPDEKVKYLKRNILSKGIGLTSPFISDELGRVLGGIGEKTVEGTLELGEDIYEGVTGKKASKDFKRFKRDLASSVGTVAAGFNNMEADKDEDGIIYYKVKDPKTQAGKITEGVGTFVANYWGGKKLFADVLSNSIKKNVKPDTKLLKVLQGANTFTKAEYAAQTSLNPEDGRIAYYIGEYFGERSDLAKSVVDYLDLEDPTELSNLENRIGMLVENLVLTGALGVTGLATIAGYQLTKEGIIKPTIKGGKIATDSIIKTLNKIKGKGQDSVNSFKRTVKEGAKSEKARKAPAKKDVSIQEQLIFDPNDPIKNGLRKAWRAITTSEGSYTPQMFKTIKDAEKAKIAWSQRAEDLQNNLQKQIDNLVQSDDLFLGYSGNRDEFVNKVITQILEGRQGFNKQFYNSLSDKVQNQLTNIRETIDALSTMSLQTKGLSKDLKNRISEGVGKYMRTSYRRFEDKSFRPSQQIIDDAVNSIYKKLLKKKEAGIYGFKTMKDSVALERAKTMVNKLLQRKSGQTYQNWLDDTLKGKKDMDVIYQKKKQFSPEIKKLFGEETDISTRIFRTVEELAHNIIDARLYEDLYAQGKGVYFFTKNQADKLTGRQAYLGREQVTGGNFGSISGKYTTPELAKMFESMNKMREQTSGFGQGLIKTFLMAKGLGQAAATVGNLYTHIRNTYGQGVIMLSNGLNPFSKDTGNAFKVLSNKLSKGDDETLQKMYADYLELGIVNQSVNVGDFKRMIQTASRKNFYKENPIDDNILKVIESKTKRGFDFIKGLGKGATDVYVAQDDLFRIATFEKELKILKQAEKSKPINIPRKTEKELIDEAATIVRNTLPTYELVPVAARQLRNYPVGNFFSFHAERFRNSYETFKRGIKEIRSDNDVLVNRGIDRLAGKLTFGSFAAAGINEGTKLLFGVSDKDDENYKNLVAPEWAKNSELAYFRNTDGDLYYVDMQFTDPDAPVNNLVRGIYNEMLNPEIPEEQVIARLDDAFITGAKSFFKPFVDEALLTDVLLDATLATGVLGENRSASARRRLDFEPDEFGRNMGNAIGTVFESLIPQTIRQFTGISEDRLGSTIYQELTEENPKNRFGQPIDSGLELMVNATGLRFNKIDDATLKDAFKYKLKELNRQNNSRKNYFSELVDKAANGSINSEYFLNEYKRKNESYYNHYYKAMKSLEAIKDFNISDFDIEQSIKENLSSFDKDEKNRFFRMSNSFQPVDLSNADFTKLLQEVNFKDMDTDTFVRTLYSLENEFKEQPLMNLEDEFKDEDEQNTRVRKVTGGLVEGKEEVPYTEEDPADRINPYTGESYSGKTELEKQMEELI